MEFVTRPLVNCGELADWAKSEGFDVLVPAAWHVTVVRAQRGCLLDTAGIVIRPSMNRSVSAMGGFFALVFRSTALARRHAAHLLAGGVWDFTVYRPHVTFSPRDRRRIADVRLYDGRLIFGPESMASLAARPQRCVVSLS